MNRSGMILMFLIASLFMVLAYGTFNAFVTNHAEEVVSRGGGAPSAAVENVRNTRCQVAQDRYDDLINNSPEDGNFELRDQRIDAALAEIERSCD